MKAAYFHPRNPAYTTSVKTPMRAALDKAGVNVADVNDEGGHGDPPTGDNDILAGSEMAGQFADIDVWISEACATGATDQSGPSVCKELGIPLVVVEPDTKIAANDHRDDALQIVGQATHIVTTCSATARYFEKLVPDGLTHWSPFIDVDPFRAAHKVRELHKSSLASKLRLPETSPWLLTDGLMAAGDSLQSYEVLAVSLSRLVSMEWKLIVVASGNAMAEAKELLRRLPQDRIRYGGPMAGPDLAAVCASCDMYVWPTVGDAPPGSLLEAQASGLPAIAGRKESTQDRVVDGRTGRLTPLCNAESFASAISFLLRHPDFMRSFSDDARDTVYAQHNLDTVAVRLSEVLSDLC